MSSITQRIEQGEQLLHEIKEGAFSATSPEQLDTKQVFEATKHSLQDLKQAIANQPDLQKKKEQEKAVLVYVQHLLGLSSLETTDKTTLQHIQQHLESNQILLDVQFEQIEQVVSNLETKIENLTASDQEKIKALQKTVDQQKRSLQSLKQGVSESVDEARKKAFEALKTELEKHRYSKWLAGPVYTFLVDKYINKKQMSKFSLWLGGIGVAVASWFLPKTIKNLIGNIDHMSVDEISNLVQSGKEKAEVVADLTLEKAKELQEEINPKLRAFFEKKFGKKFDEEKWKQVFSGWREQWKGHLGLKDLVHNVETKQDIDIIDEAFSLVTAPWKAVFDLLRRMSEAGMISWGDIALDWVVKPSGEAILNVGLSSIGLFSNAMKAIFTSMTMAEFSDYAKTHIRGMNVDSKEAMWGMLYRRWGPFWALAGHIGSLTGEVLSKVFDYRTVDDVGKIATYRKGGVLQNMKTELQVFKQLEESLKGTGVFKELHTVNAGSLLEEMLNVAKKNAQIFDIAHNAQNLTEMKNLLQQNGLTDVLNDLERNVAWWEGNLNVMKTEAGNIIEGGMKKVLRPAKDSFGRIEKVFAKIAQPPRGKFQYEKQLLKQMEEYSKLQGKMLQKTELLNSVKNLSRRFEKGRQLAGIVEYSDGAKLMLKNAEDAKDFFDNVRAIGRESPWILKTLFKGFPLIMMGSEMMNKLADPQENDSTVQILLQGFWYLTPLVGPFLLIKEGLVFHKEKGEFHSLSSAGVGAGLMAVDGFFAYRAIKHGRFLKYMVSPVVDSISFLKSMASGTYTAFKMTKDGVKLLRAGEYASVGAEAMKFLKGSGARLAGIALLAYLGYRGISALFDTSSAEEQQQLAELEKLPPQELQEKIKQEWPKLSEEEKETLIKLATAVRMKETTNLENIEVKKEGNVVKIRFKYLVNYTTMKQEEQDLQQALSELEVTKDLKIVYTLDVGEVKYALKAYKKHNDLTDQQLQEYIATIWYPDEIAQQLFQQA